MVPGRDGQGSREHHTELPSREQFPSLLAIRTSCVVFWALPRVSGEQPVLSRWLTGKVTHAAPFNPGLMCLAGACQLGLTDEGAQAGELENGLESLAMGTHGPCSGVAGPGMAGRRVTGARQQARGAQASGAWNTWAGAQLSSGGSGGSWVTRKSPPIQEMLCSPVDGGPARAHTGM